MYFGTDGIRGKVLEDIGHLLSFKCGNALNNLVKNPKVIIGRDSRKSGSYINLAFCLGVVTGGGSVDDVGICPTAGIAYLTKHLKYDFGVVISASHNPPDNNGIKIFNSQGQKLGEKLERKLESLFDKKCITDAISLGNYNQDVDLLKKYEFFLQNGVTNDLSSLKIVLDCCYGASCKIAPKVFKKLGAKVFVINNKFNGDKINVNCGATNVESLKKEVLRKKANLGLAFDGDSDRVIAVDEKGNEVDGDKILYLLANHLKKQNKLTNNLVVGTKLTNLGIQNKLKEKGIDIVLADIGDKYVVEEMITHNALLGGEKAGHIILSEYLLAGDGILTGIKIAEIMKKEQKTLSSLTNVEIYPQCSINCRVKDKDKIVSNMDLKNLVKDLENKVGNKARILVRKSGTEMLVRIMVESKDDNLAKELAKILEEKVKEIEEGN